MYLIKLKTLFHVMKKQNKTVFNNRIAIKLNLEREKILYQMKKCLIS